MKRYLSFGIICAITLWGMTTALSSCETVEDNPYGDITKLQFDIKVNNVSTIDTKVVKTDWENGDKVYVFFKANNTIHLDAMKYAILTYNSSTHKWDGACSADLTDATELGDNGTMYAVFFPFGDVAITSDGSGGVSFRTSGRSKDELNGLPIYTYYESGNASYTVETAGGIGTLSGTISLSMPNDYVYFFIDKSGTDYCADDQYRLSVDGLMPVACSGYNGGLFTETAQPSRYTVWGYAYGTAGIAFSGKIDDTWSSSSSHLFRLYNENNPTLLTKSVTASLASHSSVKLNNSWTKRGFRGYEVSPGILKRTKIDDETPSSYELTDGSNPFEMHDYYGKAASLGKYYFTWNLLVSDSELGANGSNINANSAKLPNGWFMPSAGSSSSDWEKIVRNAPSATIMIEKDDNSIASITAKDYVTAYVVINKNEKNYFGLLLLRDGSFIPKEGNLQYWGKTSNMNTLSYKQYLVLKDAGCLFISCTGELYGSEFRYIDYDNDSYVSGNYWSSSYYNDSDRSFFQFYKNGTSIRSLGARFHTGPGEYYPVRLVKKL